jgi:hypothetical protein
MCVMWHIYCMTRSQETPEDVERWFRSQLKKLWPAGLGSLSLRRSPCIRDRCHSCQTGEQHSSYVLYGRHQHKRFAVYFPDALAPELRQMLENGRALQSLLYEAARRYAEALKRARPAKR